MKREAIFRGELVILSPRHHHHGKRGKLNLYLRFAPLPEQESRRATKYFSISRIYFLQVWKIVQIYIGVQGTSTLVIAYTICDSSPTPLFIANDTINCFQ